MLSETFVLHCVNNASKIYFRHNKRYFKQPQRTAIGTKFAPPYAILFFGYSEDRISNFFIEKPIVLWLYMDYILMWQHKERIVKNT